jgi:DNA-directed RNA polymerase specialized sigma24 family protein
VSDVEPLCPGCSQPSADGDLCAACRRARGLTTGEPGPSGPSALTEDERWGDLPDWAELGAVSDEIDGVEKRLKQLQDERREMYRRLAGQGVPVAALARKVGLSPMAVKFALDPATRPKRKKVDKPAKKAAAK